MSTMSANVKQLQIQVFSSPKSAVADTPQQQNISLGETPDRLFVVGVARRGVWVSPQVFSSPLNRATWMLPAPELSHVVQDPLQGLWYLQHQ